MIGWAHVELDAPADPSVADAWTDFWASALGWSLGASLPGHPELRSFAPADGDAYVHTQRVNGPPSIHLDLEVDDVAESRDRLVGLGAGVVRVREDWTTLSSPGGWEFCLVGRQDHRRPTATQWRTGQRSRLVQVCLDTPAAVHRDEVEFWRQATGWRWRVGGRPEFAGKLFPASGSSVQLLLHRLGEDDEGLTTRAHLDLGADDWAAETARLIDLGATREWSGDGWVTLRDPAGLLFCVTENSPDAP